MKQKHIIIIIIALIVTAFILVYMFTNQDTSNYGKLYINEIVVNNVNLIKDEDGEFSDYIELYNGYKFDINLEGYHLSDKEFKTDEYIIPNVTIKSGEYLIIFASGKDKNEEYVHTNFKLSDKGEVVTLSDKENNVLSKVRYKETAINSSYGFNGRKYVYYNKGTPKEKNTGDYSENPITIKDEIANLKITEYIINNKIIYDADGNYSPMVEIYNPGDDFNVEGMFITDKESNLNKYMLPNAIIKKNEYLVIYLSGKDEYKNNEIHTNFKIKEGENIILVSKGGTILDNVVVKNIPSNTSYGLIDKEWYYFPTPTFGKENNTTHFVSLGGNNE